MYYSELAVAGKRKIQTGCAIRGLCYSDDTLYTVEQLHESNRCCLVAYKVHHDGGDITKLDSIELEVLLPLSICPRVEHHTQRVFIPGDSGVTVARLHQGRLVKDTTLTCVRDAAGVDFISHVTAYVSDYAGPSVRVVDVGADKITSTLETPDRVRNERPDTLAVLDDRVMVGYSSGCLVIYNHGSPAPATVVPQADEPIHPRSISTDRQRHFLITYSKPNAVFVFDVSGNIRHALKIDTDSMAIDCAVINGQLWVGCLNGDVIMLQK